jgi:hypothetical protein
VINIPRAATSAIIPVLPESYTFPSVLLGATRWEWECPAMRSPWRELGETRTVTVDALWDLAPHVLLFHMVLTPKSQKPLVTVSPPTNQTKAIRRVTLLPLFPIGTYKVARRRKSFQFSLAVCLVTGTLNNKMAKSAERFWSDAVSPTWKIGFRGSLSISLSSADL